MHVVPLDEVIDTMFLVGESMPRELCCTGLGGLAITPDRPGNLDASDFDRSGRKTSRQILENLLTCYTEFV